jgi:hypothetical protein
LLRELPLTVAVTRFLPSLSVVFLVDHDDHVLGNRCTMTKTKKWLL